MAFNLFKKKKDEGLEIVAPLNGKVVPLEEVPDPVFSQKMMGEGIAIVPTDGQVHSPVDGKIVQVAPTKHAVGIEAEDGTEILIHFGLETVALKGEGFEMKVTDGQSVSKGDILLVADLDYVKENADHIITPIIITNSSQSDKIYEFTSDKNSIAGETVMITVSK